MKSRRKFSKLAIVFLVIFVGLICVNQVSSQRENVRDRQDSTQQRRLERNENGDRPAQRRPERNEGTRGDSRSLEGPSSSYRSSSSYEEGRRRFDSSGIDGRASRSRPSSEETRRRYDNERPVREPSEERRRRPDSQRSDRASPGTMRKAPTSYQESSPRRRSDYERTDRSSSSSRPTAYEESRKRADSMDKANRAGPPPGWTKRNLPNEGKRRFDYEDEDRGPSGWSSRDRYEESSRPRKTEESSGWLESRDSYRDSSKPSYYDEERTSWSKAKEADDRAPSGYRRGSRYEDEDRPFFSSNSPSRTSFGRDPTSYREDRPRAISKDNYRDARPDKSYKKDPPAYYESNGKKSSTKEGERYSSGKAPKKTSSSPVSTKKVQSPKTEQGKSSAKRPASSTSSKSFKTPKSKRTDEARLEDVQEAYEEKIEQEEAYEGGQGPSYEEKPSYEEEPSYSPPSEPSYEEEKPYEAEEPSYSPPEDKYESEPAGEEYPPSDYAPETSDVESQPYEEEYSQPPEEYVPTEDDGPSYIDDSPAEVYEEPVVEYSAPEQKEEYTTEKYEPLPATPSYEESTTASYDAGKTQDYAATEKPYSAPGYSSNPYQYYQYRQGKLRAVMLRPWKKKPSKRIKIVKVRPAYYGDEISYPSSYGSSSSSSHGSTSSSYSSTAYKAPTHHHSKGHKVKVVAAPSVKPTTAKPYTAPAQQTYSTTPYPVAAATPAYQQATPAPAYNYAPPGYVQHQNHHGNKHHKPKKEYVPWDTYPLPWKKIPVCPLGTKPTMRKGKMLMCSLDPNAYPSFSY